MNYPIQIITNYRAGKISRQQFQQQFSDWQKSHGINYDCKGYADKSGVYMTYRGRTARITNDLLVWVENHKTQTAKKIREMKNKIDIYAQGVKWT